MDNQRRLLVACVAALIGWLIWPWFFLPGYKASHTYSPDIACRNSLREISDAKELWARKQEGLTNGTPVGISNIVDDLKAGSPPKCRRGGDYGIGAIGEEPRCTAHGTVADIDRERAREIENDKEGATACLAAYFIVACILAALPALVAVIGHRKRSARMTEDP